MTNSRLSPPSYTAHLDGFRADIDVSYEKFRDSVELRGLYRKASLLMALEPEEAKVHKLRAVCNVLVSLQVSNDVMLSSGKKIDLHGKTLVETELENLISASQGLSDADFISQAADLNNRAYAAAQNWTLENSGEIGMVLPFTPSAVATVVERRDGKKAA